MNIDYSNRASGQLQRPSLALPAPLGQVTPSLSIPRRQCAISPSRTALMGTIVNGHTAESEMMRLRLERARDILIRTNDSFETIAFNCGFSATSHFSTAFKRQFGTAPSVFRRRAHQHH